MTREALLHQVATDHEQFQDGLLPNFEAHILDRYGISLATEYAGHPIRNPFGKASGQLSLNTHQIEHDAQAGLGFVVLKTLIAESASGDQSMSAWAIPEARMKVEQIGTRRSDAREPQGWTVTWKGRGWSGTLEEYLMLFDRSLEISSAFDTLIVPSCKYHLPTPDEHAWRTDEYEYTTNRLLETWRVHRMDAMPIEKDFSPTLAGDTQYSRVQETIVEWLRQVPALIRRAAPIDALRVGLKIFNAQFDDAFQTQMLETCENADDDSRADYLVYANRLFDPQKEFEGKRGMAYGGPDLSARNLSILSRHKLSLPFSATGDIVTGATALAYFQRGATSAQMHTLFQLPDSEFAMTRGTRSERALHRLLFHPEHGLLQAIVRSAAFDATRGIAISELPSLLDANSFS